MAFRIFQYPLPAADDLQDLNKFLASHKVVVVDRQIVSASSGSLLVFIVEYIAGGGGESKKPVEGIDYQKVLETQQFSIYLQLREVRRIIAETEGVPLYKVFTNAQLAQMVQQGCTTKASLLRIQGVGAARVEKYAERFLEVLQAVQPSSAEEQSS